MAARSKPIKSDVDDYDGAGTASEIAAFQKRLSSIDLATLRGHLEQKTISRRWKRVLVEAEFARRTGDDPDDDMGGRAPRPRWKTEGWGRWTAAAIIAVCSVILAYTFYQFL
jgi:hypothetical protein